MVSVSPNLCLLNEPHPAGLRPVLPVPEPPGRLSWGPRFSRDPGEPAMPAPLRAPRMLTSWGVWVPSPLSCPSGTVPSRVRSCSCGFHALTWCGPSSSCCSSLAAPLFNPLRLPPTPPRNLLPGPHLANSSSSFMPSRTSPPRRCLSRVSGTSPSPVTPVTPLLS